jgi:hypothetical protein
MLQVASWRRSSGSEVGAPFSSAAGASNELQCCQLVSCHSTGKIAYWEASAAGDTCLGYVLLHEAGLPAWLVQTNSWWRLEQFAMAAGCMASMLTKDACAGLAPVGINDASTSGPISGVFAFEGHHMLVAVHSNGEATILPLPMDRASTAAGSSRGQMPRWNPPKVLTLTFARCAAIGLT